MYYVKLNSIIIMLVKGLLFQGASFKCINQVFTLGKVA